MEKQMSLNKSFPVQLQEKTEQMEQIVREYLPAEDKTGEYQQSLIRSMNYSMLAGGKRLRPMLMGEIYRLFGGSEEVIRPFQAAIEMIHTFSLVHDDLPCMDNDRYRRGKETTWAVFGEDMATLSGDALSLYAFETAGKGFAMSAFPERVGRAMCILAREAGVYGMCGGQSVDVEETGKPLNMEQLSFIYDLKTGALLRASMEIGAVLAGAEDAEADAARQMADAIGMAFQIRDDILDVSGTAETLGKPIGSDEKNHKTTWVTLTGMEQAQKKTEEYSEKAIRLLEQLEENREGNPFLKELIRELMNRKK